MNASYIIFYGLNIFWRSRLSYCHCINKILQLVMYVSSACCRRYNSKLLTLQLSQTVRDKCFDKCITKPGSSLSGSEGSCISRCVDRYIEATGIISKALFSQRWNCSWVDLKACLLSKCWNALINLWYPLSFSVLKKVLKYFVKDVLH